MPSPSPHALHPPRSRRPFLRGAVLIGVGVAWGLTLALVWRRELRAADGSDDVRALVEASRLSQQHASATHVIRIGSLEVGRLSSRVSGGQTEEQLAYVLRGRLRQPQVVELRGFVLADWDRRPQRFVLELFVAGRRHRIDGGIERAPGGGVTFSARSVLDGGERRYEWVLPEAPVLVPGPLPLPELPLLSSQLPGWRAGTMVDPVTGEPQSWSIETTSAEDLIVAGRPRPCMRHVVHYGPHVVSLWTEAGGFPLRAELPLDIVIELVEESR